MARSEGAVFDDYTPDQAADDYRRLQAELGEEDGAYFSSGGEEPPDGYYDGSFADNDRVDESDRQIPGEAERQGAGSSSIDVTDSTLSAQSGGNGTDEHTDENIGEPVSQDQQDQEQPSAETDGDAVNDGRVDSTEPGEEDSQVRDVQEHTGSTRDEAVSAVNATRGLNDFWKMIQAMRVEQSKTDDGQSRQVVTIVGDDNIEAFNRHFCDACRDSEPLLKGASDAGRDAAQYLITKSAGGSLREMSGQDELTKQIFDTYVNSFTQTYAKMMGYDPKDLYPQPQQQNQYGSPYLTRLFSNNRSNQFPTSQAYAEQQGAVSRDTTNQGTANMSVGQALSTAADIAQIAQGVQAVSNAVRNNSLERARDAAHDQREAGNRYAEEESRKGWLNKVKNMASGLRASGSGIWEKIHDTVDAHIGKPLRDLEEKGYQARMARRAERDVAQNDNADAQNSNTGARNGNTGASDHGQVSQEEQSRTVAQVSDNLDRVTDTLRNSGHPENAELVRRSEQNLYESAYYGNRLGALSQQTVDEISQRHSGYADFTIQKQADIQAQRATMAELYHIPESRSVDRANEPGVLTMQDIGDKLSGVSNLVAAHNEAGYPLRNEDFNDAIGQLRYNRGPRNYVENAKYAGPDSSDGVRSEAAFRSEMFKQVFDATENSGVKLSSDNKKWLNSNGYKDYVSDVKKLMKVNNNDFEQAHMAYAESQGMHDMAASKVNTKHVYRPADNSDPYEEFHDGADAQRQADERQTGLGDVRPRTGDVSSNPPRIVRDTLEGEADAIMSRGDGSMESQSGMDVGS